MKLSKSQKRILKEIKTKDKSIVYMGCGMGKSLVALLASKGSKDVVVVSPPRLIKNWTEGEIEKWGFKGIKVLSPYKKELFRGIKPDFTILDESHLFTSNNWRHVHDLIRKSKKAVLLTATPFLGKPEDCYIYLKLCEMLSSGYYKEQFFKEFCKGEYNFGAKRIVPTGYSNVKKLKKLFSLTTFKALRKVNIKKYKIHLGEAPKLDWNDIENYSTNMKAFSFFKVTNFSFKNALKRVLGKNKRVIVFYFHELVGKELLNQLKNYEGYIKKIDGKSNKLKILDFIEEFENSEKGVLIANYQVLGQGFNVNKASAVLFAECTWSPSKDKQCYMRAYRFKRKKSLKVYFPFFKNEKKLLIQKKKLKFINLLK